ncbi:hypothetical protein ACOI22_03435 [Glaciecola sp. 2405UD65-10]|uniref:hypothetical protein n=1 Tax=Glaciecola sp. 2405UD65-10 TaxID=3397244 RepID=UPI003B59D6DC
MIMPMVEDTRTIKHARAELRAWGKFWQSYTINTGGSSLMASFIQSQKSATKYHKRPSVKIDNKCKGVDVSYSASCSPTRSTPGNHNQDVYVPIDLRAIDDLIENMKVECRRALSQKYISKLPIKGFWIDKAERIVMNEL